jgi:hypothetical protein
MPNPIYDKIQQIIEGFTTVSVTTRVLTGDQRFIKTDINVVSGDTTFEIHEDYLPDPSKLNEFHRQQVIAAKETLTGTMESLGALAEKVGDKLEEYLARGR